MQLDSFALHQPKSSTQPFWMLDCVEAEERSLFHFLDEENVLYLLAWGDYLSDLVLSRVGEFIWSSAHQKWPARKFQLRQYVAAGVKPI